MYKDENNLSKFEWPKYKKTIKDQNLMFKEYNDSNNNPIIKEKIIVDYMYLVEKLAKEASYYCDFPIDALQIQCYKSLVNAIDDFDYQPKERFEKFLSKYFKIDLSFIFSGKNSYCLMNKILSDTENTKSLKFKNCDWKEIEKTILDNLDDLTFIEKNVIKLLYGLEGRAECRVSYIANLYHLPKEKILFSAFEGLSKIRKNIKLENDMLTKNIDNKNYKKSKLSKGEEQELLLEYSETKNLKLRDEILFNYTYLVDYHASNLAKEYDFDVNELKSFGFEGLLISINEYNPLNTDMSFSVYVNEKIYKSILLGIREIQRLQLDEYVDYHEIKKHIKETYGESIIDDSIKNDEFIDILINNEREQKLYDEVENLEIHDYIFSYLNDLTFEERNVIELLFGFKDDKVYLVDEIAEKLAISPENVRIIAKTAMKKLKAYFTKTDSNKVYVNKISK